MGVRVRADGANVLCKAPKGVMTAELQAQVTYRKTEILALLGERASDQDSGPVRLGPMPRLGELPLSFAQQRLWFLDQLDPGTAAYTIAARRRLPRSLDLRALSETLTELVRRHESLRTTFVSRDGEPRQQIAGPEPVTPELIDLEGMPTPDRARIASDIVRDLAHRPFTLARGPLFRPVVLRHAPDEHELLMSIHHIVADGWSMGIIASELDILYAAFAEKQPSPLTDLPLQYADFTLWQRQWLTGTTLEAQRVYWRTRLAALPEPLEIQTDRPRAAQKNAAGASHDFECPASLADSLRELGRREGATLFMTLLAGFKALLFRYTGRPDIVVGTPVANRTQVELEAIVGFFANMLPLRSDLSGDPSFRQLLGRVRETSLGAYAHQDMPFDKLVQELQPDRRSGQNPVFQVSFVLQGTATGPTFDFVTVGSPFDLTLFVRAGSVGPLHMTIEYKRDLFDPETIARLAGHYQTLLEGAAADPECRLSILPLQNGLEVRRLLIDWNATDTPEAMDAPVPGLFETLVARTPAAPAARFEGQSLSYSELNRRVNRLARYLRRHGADRGVLVGIFVERSVEMLIAVLAVMKTRAAYVPLDPAYPAERLEFMLRDADVPLVISQAALLGRISIPAMTRVLAIDRDAGAIEAELEDNLGEDPHPDDLAYVIYTSGSTGRPKGVQINHRSLANVLAAFRRTLDVDGSDVLVAVTTLSFDIAALELLLPLVSGAQVVLASRDVAADPTKLMALFTETCATLVQATPTTWRMLLEAGWRYAKGLRILCGGEAFPAELSGPLLATGGSVWNVYGPTETTIWSTLHRVQPGDNPVPIGRPIANTRTYVLDPSGEPLPIGVPGELYIGGAGVANGYLHRPELTAERFVPDRFSGRSDARLYRTGDVARYRADGALECLGRLDDQVKVRGFRVELGEIESVLASHPAITHTVVTVREDRPGDRHLAAYFRRGNTVSPSGTELRTFLRERLPDYMIPSTFTELEMFPLTPNGKVDRRQLPKPDSGVELSHVVEPRDEVERQLVRLWEEILGVTGIGTRDNFFDLGGHSLLAVRMFAQLEASLRVRLPLATLFRTPTIEGLAGLIRDGVRPGPWRSLVAIQPAGNRRPVFAVPGVGGHVLCYADLARFMAPEQPFYGLQSRGLDGSQRPLTNIESIARSFLEEVREVQAEGPYTLLGMCMGGVVVYEMAQQLRAEGQQVGPLIMLETWPPSGTPQSWLQPGTRFLTAMRLIRGRLQLYSKALARLNGPQRIRYLFDRLKMLKEMVTQRDVFRGDRSDYYLDLVTQTNLSAYQKYEPRMYPGHVVFFRAAERQVSIADDRRLDWRKYLTGQLQVRTVPGEDSGLMLAEPHVQVLAREIRACIEHTERTQ